MKTVSAIAIHNNGLKFEFEIDDNANESDEVEMAFNLAYCKLSQLLEKVSIIG